MNQEENSECQRCGQVDIGQTGEYPCVECGLPIVWDQETHEQDNKEKSMIKFFCERCNVPMWEGVDIAEFESETIQEVLTSALCSDCIMAEVSSNFDAPPFRPIAILQFTYIDDEVPDRGDRGTVVMAAWTDEDETEFHIVPSVLGTGSHWIAQDDFFNGPGWHVYAWADWPSAPEMKRRDESAPDTVSPRSFTVKEFCSDCGGELTSGNLSEHSELG